MPSEKLKVLSICGSTRGQSSNLQIIEAIAQLAGNNFEVEIYRQLADLPHFNPDLDQETAPAMVQELRSKISTANGVLICTPEYVFSLPGSLKNAIEWTVSTTLFAGKPTSIITASGLGEKAHESLQLIMKTVEAKMTEETQLLVTGARSKLNPAGEISDPATLGKVKELITAFTRIMFNQ